MNTRQQQASRRNWLALQVGGALGNLRHSLGLGAADDLPPEQQQHLREAVRHLQAVVDLRVAAQAAQAPRPWRLEYEVSWPEQQPGGTVWRTSYQTSGRRSCSLRGVRQQLSLLVAREGDEAPVMDGGVLRRPRWRAVHADTGEVVVLRGDCACGGFWQEGVYVHAERCDRAQ